MKSQSMIERSQIMYAECRVPLEMHTESSTEKQ